MNDQYAISEKVTKAISPCDSCKERYESCTKLCRLYSKYMMDVNEPFDQKFFREFKKVAESVIIAFPMFSFMVSVSGASNMFEGEVKIYSGNRFNTAKIGLGALTAEGWTSHCLENFIMKQIVDFIQDCAREVWAKEDRKQMEYYMKVEEFKELMKLRER